MIVQRVQIPPNCAREYLGNLRNYPDTSPQKVQAHLRSVHAVDFDVGINPAFNFNHPKQGLNYCGFTRASAPHEGGLLSGVNVEG